MEDRIVEMAFIIVNSKVTAEEKPEFESLKDEYLRIIDEYSHDEELEYMLPKEDKEWHKIIRVDARQKIESGNLSENEKLSYFLNYHSIEPIRNCFFLSPAFFPTQSDFISMSDNNTVLKKLYWGEIGYIPPYSFPILDIKIAFESFILPEEVGTKFIDEIITYCKDSCLIKAAKQFDKGKTVIVHKVL
ncbi:hypothetical protein M2451_001050 [Dysgonomonas sp. PFB1-18]|uniref:hypothetical protein n=1 Tax=unclassified Dysgonomonas TaxID=2630389 RepID=UPI002475E03C|nr:MULTISPECIES: hypothetical protein [unclassified Dysgonomonas]MDH6308326.1 hypothetical protein [Dysgonomonas sp. PF1-14]MDH6338236.1 hypothetical protein [Dysgonomonas sp. PF1-16]MDH6379733.1 hypothetical protein [Dysgonomonas sp. PFB1-18]MDH6397177.1 hypothetical protein [Dysgonomonas sp. PF1-23]